MYETKWKEGELIEFIPGNHLHEGYNTRFWMEGAGIILAIEDDCYVIQVYNLVKTSAKNLSTYDIGSTMVKLPAKDCDLNNCFRSLED
jgi:hypothetical protein